MPVNARHRPGRYAAKRPPAPLLLLAAVLAVMTLPGLTACGGAAGHPPATASRPSGPTPLRYAALGDSYTAAPYVYLTDLAQGCARSDHNYPHLLAHRLGARLADVSCSGARSTDLPRSGHTLSGTTVPPQARVVDRRTDLVTVGIGGNDGALFHRLQHICPLPGIASRPSVCRNLERRHIDAVLARLPGRLLPVLRDLRRRAPHALVVLVGYSRIAGSRGCPPRLPFGTQIVRQVDRLQQQLSRRMATAARSAGVRFLDMYAASRGHDVCSRRPWVNGIFTDTHRAAALHPLLAGQRAVADRLSRLVAHDPRLRPRVGRAQGS